MKRELRLGSIGFGLRSYLLRHAHKPEQGSRVVGVADIREEKFSQARLYFGEDVFCTSDYRQLISRDDVDAIFILSPDYLHCSHALECMAAGKDIYIEKPLAITISECDLILEKAKEMGRKIYIGHNMRHMKFVRKMKEIIDDGTIGKVKAAWCRHFVSYGGDAYFKDWHSERSKSTGLLLQKGTHDIDVLHWLCGGYTKRVVAMGALTLYDKIKDRHPASEYGDAKAKEENWPPLSQKGFNPAIDVEDLNHVLLELDNGVLATYQQCHYTPDAWRNYTIIGTHGRIENVGDFCTDTKIKIWTKRHDSFHESEHEIDINRDLVGHERADEAIVEDFINYLRSGICESCFAIESRNSVAAGYCATISLRNGSIPVEIPFGDKKIIEYYSHFGYNSKDGKRLNPCEIAV
jgi:predicted dehydrogenase